jgi:ABC-type transport system substrate-binding protein
MELRAYATPKLRIPSRSTLSNLQTVEVVDKYTVRCRLHTPSAAFLADVAYYPCNLIAPESAAEVTRPHGLRSVKLVRWGATVSIGTLRELL